MPADRITTSFSEAQRLGLPLSSHGPRHAPSIARGNACGTCRKRKLKCDGVKPLCGSCRKSAIVHGEDPDRCLPCEYADPNAPKKKRASPGSKVAALEDTIANLKAMLAKAGIDPENGGSSSESSPAPQPFPQYSTLSATTSSSVAPANLALPNFGFTSPQTYPMTSTGATSLPDPLMSQPAFSLPPTLDMNSFVDATTTTTTTSHGFNFQSSSMRDLPLPPQAQAAHQQPSPPFTTSSSTNDATPPLTPPSPFFYELFYPGWPKTLPSPDLTTRLTEIYFSKPHICQDMINPSKFRADMLLPPTAFGFPHLSLLHAMCALAAKMVSPDYFAAEEIYWVGYSSPSDYHFAKAKTALDSAIGKGAKFLRIAQASVLLTYFCYTEGKFADLWLMVGNATRICTPLGLNHLRAASDEPAQPAHNKGYLIQGTDDQEELYERAMVFYNALMADRFSSASTGWATSIDEEDYTTPIPSLARRQPTSPLELSALSPRNPNFWIAHPPHLVGPLQLFLKAIILLGKAVQFTQRAPHVLRSAAEAMSLNDPIKDVRSTDAFKRIDAMIATFLASIPREYQFTHRQTPGVTPNVLTETRLCLTHAMSHNAIILLHEPWVNSAGDQDESMRKCLTSANEILNTIFVIIGTSYEVSRLSPFINFCWAVAGRTFVRKLGMLMIQNILQGQEEMKSNVQTILAVLRAHKTPLGDMSALQLEFLLENPLRTLPQPLLALVDLSLHPMPTNVPDCTLFIELGAESSCHVEPNEDHVPLFPTATSASASIRVDSVVVELLRGNGAFSAKSTASMAMEMDAFAASADGKSIDASKSGEGWYTKAGLGAIEALLEEQGV
ncbi:C6 transcription factor [Rhodotorula toruloides]|uniref:C6 transcription factor n=1 Tax=Rhodotorula toruloides TaxID=5286 RepID=A0A511KE72_RHOTO|nr:C6 transcription factor [Rhodotorula toruloides]